MMSNKELLLSIFRDVKLHEKENKTPSEEQVKEWRKQLTKIDKEAVKLEKGTYEKVYKVITQCTSSIGIWEKEIEKNKKQPTQKAKEYAKNFLEFYTKQDTLTKSNILETASEETMDNLRRTWKEHSKEMEKLLAKYSFNNHNKLRNAVMEMKAWLLLNFSSREDDEETKTDNHEEKTSVVSEDIIHQNENSATDNDMFIPPENVQYCDNEEEGEFYSNEHAQDFDDEILSKTDMFGYGKIKKEDQPENKTIKCQEHLEQDLVESLQKDHEKRNIFNLFISELNNNIIVENTCNLNNSFIAVMDHFGWSKSNFKKMFQTLFSLKEDGKLLLVQHGNEWVVEVDPEFLD